MEKSSHALKEWSPVVDALGKGIQTILSRKYPPAHNEFFLYPTYGFSIHKHYLSLYFQPQHHDLVKQSVESKKKGKTTIQFYAIVNGVIRVPRTDFERLKKLQNYFIWSPDHVFNYFSDEKFKEAYIWILRIHRIPVPQSINDLGRGALRFANLPFHISIAGCTPVLDDVKFQSTIGEIKQNLEQVSFPHEDIIKLQETIQQLQKLLQDKEEKIRQLENLLGPSPAEIVIRKFSNFSELSPEDFEWQLKQAFETLGFDAKWNGQLKDERPFQTAPQGKPDVEVKALLAGDPYFVVVEGTKVDEERYQVTEVHGADDHSAVSLEPPYKTCYRIVIAPRFRKGAIEACEKIKSPVMLLSCQDLSEILKFHLEVGGITQEELKHLFDKLNARGEIKREYIEEWEKTVEEQRKKLSLALDVYDILYSEKGFMWSHEIWRELKRVRSQQGLPLESLQDVHDILKILDTIGAVVVKPSPDGDFEKYDYKAGLTPEGFRLRIRKLEETIRLHESKEPRRGNKLTSWIEDRSE